MKIDRISCRILEQRILQIMRTDHPGYPHDGNTRLTMSQLMKTHRYLREIGALPVDGKIHGATPNAILGFVRMELGYDH